MPNSSVSKMAQNNLLHSKTPASEIMVRPSTTVPNERPHRFRGTRSSWAALFRARAGS
jgi:hypothetical protein